MSETTCKNCGKLIAPNVAAGGGWRHVGGRREHGSFWCDPNARIVKVPITEPCAEPVEPAEGDE